MHKRTSGRTGDINSFCTYRAFGEISNQLMNSPKAKAEEKAKKDAADKAAREEALAKVELPKATKKDPSIEKQIAAAYKAAYPDNTVLTVLLQSTGWSTERSSFGVITGRNIQAVVANRQKSGDCELHSEAWLQESRGRSFAGPLQPRGAGSQEKTDILCANVK